MLELKLPTGQNPVLSAYEAVLGGKDMQADELIAQYNHHFNTPPLVPSGTRPVFERFSLVDPTIRTVIQSSTAALR